MDNKSVKDGVLVESCTRYEARISVKRFAEAGPKIQQDTVNKTQRIPPLDYNLQTARF